MKKKILQKGICGALIAAMAVGLCACGSKGGSGSQESDSSLAKQYVYSYENLDIPNLQDMNISKAMEWDGTVYLISQEYQWDEVTNTNTTNISLLSLNTDGSEAAEIELQGTEETGVDSGEAIAEDEAASAQVEDGTADDNFAMGDDATSSTYESDGYRYESTDFSYFVIGNDGILYGLKNYSLEDYTSSTNSISQSTNTIYAWSLNGELLWTKDLSELYSDGQDYLYIRMLVPDGDNGLMVIYDDNDNNCNRAELDAEGSITHTQVLSKGTELFNQGSSTMLKPDGTILMVYYADDYSAMYLASYDPKTDTAGEPTTLPDSLMTSGYNDMAIGKTTDIIYTTSNGLYGYSVGDEQPTQIMNFINSDLNVTNLSPVIMLDETHFIGFYYDDYDAGQQAAMFTKRNPEDIPDKKVIVLAGSWIDYDMKNRVFQFNKSNDQYRVVVKEYEQYNTTEDYQAGYTQLNNDIISGNMPDILIATESLPLDKYIEKGLLADVGKLIEEDSELSGQEFLNNVFDAYKKNDKLYYVIPSFYERTLIGKTSMLDGKTGWNAQEFLDYANSLPEGTQLMGEMTRDGFMNYIMSYGGTDYIDVNTGKCNFNSEDFKALLTYAKTLPEEINYDNYDDENWWENYQSQYRENKTVLMDAYISGLQDMQSTLNGYFGEDVTYIGFPSEDRQGAILSANNLYALSAKSKNLEGAWEFIRYYLTDEYQETLTYQIPVSKTAFMNRAQEATQKPFYLDENGEKVEYDNTFEINGESIVLDPLSQEQVNQMVEVITSTTKRGYYNEDISNIISEETAAFFAGQKSVDEVTDIIQSRAQIFVDENN